MKRYEKRQLEREEKKKEKNGDVILDFSKKYCSSMKLFHEEKKGNLFDWMLSLDFDDLSALEHQPEENDKTNAAIMYVALVAHTLSTGSDKFIDDTENSTMMKMIQYFSHLVASASLAKRGLIEIRFEDKDFFNFQAEGFNVRIVPREEVPEEYRFIYDELDKHS